MDLVWGGEMCIEQCDGNASRNTNDLKEKFTMDCITHPSAHIHRKLLNKLGEVCENKCTEK